MPLTRGLAASPLGSPSGEHRRSVAGGLEGMWDSAAGIEAAGGGGGGVSCPPELYRRQLEFVRRLVRLSLALRSVPEERRPEGLEEVVLPGTGGLGHNGANRCGVGNGGK